MGKLADWFEGRKPLQLTGYVYEASKHTGWGDSIVWADHDTRRISGHLQRRPQVGDEIVWDMQSGKRARYAVTSVEYYDQIPDNKSMDWKGLLADNRKALEYELAQLRATKEERKM